METMKTNNNLDIPIQTEYPNCDIPFDSENPYLTDPGARALTVEKLDEYCGWWLGPCFPPEYIDAKIQALIRKMEPEKMSEIIRHMKKILGVDSHAE